ncbi:serine threonine-protein kinase nek5 [Stylonychia lemnae]|uniref:Serine threonine-protein kinase nek5 n=1 Tax=Stylonychia lemnae TaxID=5949 RepID=A0A078B9K0_STYLE|nr:serine threonine-protein kinase nek5 [Stylonychia lemnae]|eukprot:CDW89922.1 serine threonine-protein kinase nek5 [Stylonychia lemnae]
MFKSKKGQQILTLMRAIKTFELKHPHIVEILDSFIDQNSFVSIFELASFSLDNIIASYIKHIHSNKTIHRDISAANILYFEEQNVLKLADFGVDTLGTSQNNAVKQDYMAPEVIQDQTLDYNEKIDIWSIGVKNCKQSTNHHFTRAIYNVIVNTQRTYSFQSYRSTYCLRISEIFLRVVRRLIHVLIVL